MISSCPGLECLLLNYSSGFGCVRINSSSLRTIGLGGSRCGEQIQLREFIVIDAPCLERLVFLGQPEAVNVSVIAAPKLEFLGCLTGNLVRIDGFRLIFGTTTILVAAEFLFLCHQKSDIYIC